MPARLCEAKFGDHLAAAEGDAFRHVAHYDMAHRGYAEVRRRAAVPTRTAEAVHRPRRCDARQRFMSPTCGRAGIHDDVTRSRGSRRAGGARTLLGVPMLQGGRTDRRRFASTARRFVPLPTSRSSWCTNFAAQAVIAIENARLLNELRQRTDELGRSVEELRALGEVSQAVNSTLDLETVLTTIVGQGGAALAHRRGRDLCVRRGAPGVSPARHLRHERDYDCSDQRPAHRPRRREYWGGDSAAQANPGPRHSQDQPSPLNEIILREGYRGILVIPAAAPRPHRWRAGGPAQDAGRVPTIHHRAVARPLPTSRWWRSRMRACSKAWKPARANWRSRWRICEPRRTAWCRRRSLPRSAS